MEYKNLQRLEIQAFGTASADLLELIRSQILSETYQPQPVRKVHLPKSKYTNRTYTLLSVPDWIVYTAIVTLISEAVMQKNGDSYNKSLFSNVPRVTKGTRSTVFFKSWKAQYNKFNRVSKKYVTQGFAFLAEVDITAFYDLVDHDLLLELVRLYFTDTYVLELLERMLKCWSSTDGTRLFSHGIPQGPEASAFLGDLFLYGLDERMVSRSKVCRFLRYVDDMRIFSRTERRANAQAVFLEGEIKKLGLAPNTSKSRVINAKNDRDWLKEESSPALALGSGFRWPKAAPKSVQKMRHLVAKAVFLDNCKSKGYTPINTYLARRSIPKLLPDQEVIGRIIKVYEERPDLYDLFFMYLKECGNTGGVARFCWRQLRAVPIRDWECANLMEVAMRAQLGTLGASQTRLLARYREDTSLPLAASTAAGILIGESATRPTAAITRSLPAGPPYLPRWLVPALGLHKRKAVMDPSTRATVKRLLTSPDPSTSFMTSYLIATQFSPAVLAALPAPTAPHSRLLFQTLGHTTADPLVDEIAPLLNRVFHVKIPSGFDFRAKLGAFDPLLYDRAFRHLQLASWYASTSPTHFVNHIHNFNHVLLHFLLHNGSFVTKPTRWTYTFSQIGPKANPRFTAAFPTVASVFNTCRVARNTSLSNHPYAEVYSRFTKLVTYADRDRLISLLKAAYTEFMAKA